MIGSVNVRGARAAELASLAARTTELEQKVSDVSSSIADLDVDVAGLTAKVNLLSLKYGTNVGGNSFLVDFTTLDGLAVTGVWNSTEGRMEF